MYGNPTENSNVVATVYDYEKDMRLNIQLSRWILKPIGVWPKSAGISWTEKYVYVLINVICTSLIGFLFIPCATFITLEVEDTYNTLKLSGPLSFCVMAVVKYSSLIFRENDIYKGIEQIEYDWTSTQHYDDQIIMIKNAKFSRRLVVICVFFMYGGVMFHYLAVPFTNGKITDDSNLTYRPLPFPVARAIIDVRYSSINEIFFWIQFLSGFVLHSITASCCSLAAVFAMHAYSRLEVLIQWIEHLVDGREDFCGSEEKRLAIIVQQHVRILNFISLTDKIFREISMIEVVGCTLCMCLLGYYTITEWQGKQPASQIITHIFIFISFTFNIFIFCYIGELVTEQCKKIGEISYLIDWHRLPGRRSLALILIIAMSNSSIKLTAGNFFELSLSTFGDVIRTSVAYLNMLRTLTS